MKTQKLLTNCRVYTLDAHNTVAEAVAISNGVVAAVGSHQEIERVLGSSDTTEILDLDGKTVIPGLIDSHIHLIDYGIESTRSVDLSGSKSIREVQDRLRVFRCSHPNLPWILGRRFDQELFSERRWITKRDLDEVSAEVPILISRVCLHAVVVNSAAIKAIGPRLSAEQAKTGILTEGATSLAWKQVPSVTLEERAAAARWALEEARRVGLCGVHCIVDSWEDLEVLRSLHARGKLPVRVRVLCPESMVPGLAGSGIRTGSGDEFLKHGAVKLFVDGAMGPRTAAMREPFSDAPKDRGQLFRNERELADALVELQTMGFQAAIHAIGDRAVECALNAIERASNKTSGNPYRHRIEHASQMGEDLVAQMAELDVIACVQPQFVITDFWTRQRVGPARYRWSYPFKSMLRAGIKLAMGSDCPVERLDPIELIDRAVHREPHSLAERLTVEEVIRAYAYGSALSAFDEIRLGSIEVGKIADFTILDRDIFECASDQLASVKAAGAVVGGAWE